MARIQNVLFGKLAVSTRFITEGQLEECLQEQRRLEGAGEQPPRLGEILEQKGYLTKQQIRSILETMASMQRRLFGEIAISFHFITLEQLQTALDVQRFLKSPMDSVPLFGQALIAYRQFLKSARDGGPVPKIGEILVAMGYLKEHQVEVIIGEQNKKIVQCKSCGAGLNIGSYGEGQKLRCGQCASVLVLERNQFGELDAVLPSEEDALPQVAASPAPTPQPVGSAVPAASPAPRPATSVTTRPSQIAKSPTAFGDFTIQSKLGQDSTGTLYKAHQVSKNRPVVVKIMNQAVMQDAVFAKRFTDEARKVAGLVHPNIKKIYAIGQVDSRAYMAMEFVEGESVHAILAKQTRIHHTQALRIGKKIAEALKYAWDTGKIIHGDIRPSNILVLKTGEVMLSNLGLATKTAENILTIAKSGQLAPFYLAPELVTEDRSIDCRSDIYSLGATLYHMVAGRPPYQGQSPFEVLVRLTEERVAPLKFFDATIPDAICIVVEKMLAVEPDERYPSYDDLIHDLSKIEEVSADVDASMLLGERPAKGRKTTVQLMAVGGAEASAAPSGTEDPLLRKKTTTVIRTDSGDLQTIPTKSGTPIFLWIGAAAVVLIASFFVFSSNTATNEVDTAFQAVADECRRYEAEDNWDAVIEKWNEFQAKHPDSSKSAEAQARIAAAEESRVGAAGRALEQVRNDIKRKARDEGIPAAQRCLDPGMLPPVLTQPKYASEIEALRTLIQELAKTLFEEGKAAAWVLAKDKKDPEGAQMKLGDLKNRVPDYVEQIEAELKELEKWVEAEKQRAKEAAARKREEESKRHLDEIVAQVDKLAMAWEIDKAVELCNNEIGTLEPNHQRDLQKLQEDIEGLRVLRLQLVDYWMPILSANNDPPPDADPRPLIVLEQGEYRVFHMELDLVHLKDREQRVLRKPWKDIPIKGLYNAIAVPALVNGTGDHHLALGTVLLRALALADAEKEFRAAGDQGKNVEAHLARMEEAFSREAEKCLTEARTFQKGKKPREAVRCCVRLKNEFGDRAFYKGREAEIAKLSEEVFRESEAGADYFGFDKAGDLGTWVQDGDGSWSADGVLTGSGKKRTLSTEAKAVTSLQFVLQIPDGRSRLTISIGDFRAQFVPSNKPDPKLALSVKSGAMNPRKFSFDPAHWYVVRILFEDGKMKFLLDEQEIGTIPAKEGARDGLSFLIEGSGGAHEGKALIDHITVQHAK